MATKDALRAVTFLHIFDKKEYKIRIKLYSSQLHQCLRCLKFSSKVKDQICEPCDDYLKVKNPNLSIDKNSVLKIELNQWLFIFYSLRILYFLFNINNILIFIS